MTRWCRFLTRPTDGAGPATTLCVTAKDAKSFTAMDPGVVNVRVSVCQSVACALQPRGSSGSHFPVVDNEFLASARAQILARAGVLFTPLGACIGMRSARTWGSGSLRLQRQRQSSQNLRSSPCDQRGPREGRLSRRCAPRVGSLTHLCSRSTPLQSPCYLRARRGIRPSPPCTLGKSALHPGLGSCPHESRPQSQR